LTKFAFDATRDRGDFVAEWSLECGDYGVTLNALMAPRELHGKICLFPAPIDSEIGLQLRERDDVNVRSIYCAAPPEAQSQVKPDGSYIINPLIAADLTEYFTEEQASWEGDLWREGENWDAVLRASDPEDAAMEKLQQWLADSMKKTQAGGKVATMGFLTADHLFEVFCGMRTRLSVEDFLVVWDRSASFGFNDEFCRAFGDKPGLPERVEVEWLLNEIASGEDFRPNTFRVFIADLALKCGLQTSFLIAILMFLAGAEFTLPLNKDGVGLWLGACGKEFHPGASMNYRDFIHVAIGCKWMNIAQRAADDDPHFGEGELAVIFDAVCMHKLGSSRPSSRAVLPSQSKRRKQGKQGSQSARAPQPLIAQTVATRREYEQLIATIAQRQLKSPLNIMLDLKKRSLKPDIRAPTEEHQEGEKLSSGDGIENDDAALTSRTV
jgi:hypothetical protein